MDPRVPPCPPRPPALRRTMRTHDTPVRAKERHVATLPSVSYSITARLEVDAGSSAVGSLTNAVEHVGGMITALDVASAGHERIRIDVTCAARDTGHAQAIVDALGALEGVTVHKVSDRTFLLHLGGKIEMKSKVPLRNRDELSMAYTPGVARVSQAIAANPDDARRLTIKRNSVAVVTDGTAVLGLGDIGPEAAMPVMEGKAALFKRFADIDAWPIALDTQDIEEIVRTVQVLARSEERRVGKEWRCRMGTNKKKKKRTHDSSTTRTMMRARRSGREKAQTT